MNKAYKTVMMQPNDKVAIALMNIPAGSHVQVTCKDQKYSIEIKENIEFGHKFAVKPISRGKTFLNMEKLLA
ncbi:D-galactarate dehydratase [Bacillus salipaludis]|uniref:D-galactarate dehydratase n=1 Tax=Bacillus salipaludis TaxID=2547811 RepID=A0AA90QXU3_9BACI|nr:D-galactarate dehydratase [Bacillus salipaludis]MDQ6598864.1 D-galactarate dehydratase [Bacillus salipaludis]